MAVASYLVWSSCVSTGSMSLEPTIGHPTYYRDPASGVEMIVHVDDGMIKGPLAEIDHSLAQLREHVLVKDGGILISDVEVKYLGKLYRVAHGGFRVCVCEDPDFIMDTLAKVGLDFGSSCFHSG